MFFLPITGGGQKLYDKTQNFSEIGRYSIDNSQKKRYNREDVKKYFSERGAWKMKQNKVLSSIAVVMGILMILYIAALAMPHMEYNTSKRVPTGVGDETELVIEEGSMSILSFLGFPDSAKEAAVKTRVEKEFDADYTINSATTGPVLLIVLGILGVVAAFLLRKKFICSILPLAWSIYGIVVYFTNPYIMLGGVDYYVQLALLVVTGVIALALALLRLPGVIAERKQIREEIRITKEREKGMQAKREAAMAKNN